jgi:SMP-30/Gluconolactonase/LRE-like region
VLNAHHLSYSRMLCSPGPCTGRGDGTAYLLSVADTAGARLWAFDVEAPEPFRPHRGRVIAGLPGHAHFDRAAVMASGNSAVATLTTGSMTECSPAGDLVRAVKMVARAGTEAALWPMVACCNIDPMYANLPCHWTRTLVVHGCSQWYNHAGSAQPYCPGVGPEHGSRRAPQVPIS